MTKNAKKSVRFDPKTVCYRSPDGLDNSALWLTKKEYRDIRSHEKSLVMQVCQGVFVEGSHDSFRGLEARMIHGSRRFDGLQEVFLIQKESAISGHCNAQTIAKIYARCTKEAALHARNVAKKDARIAAAIQQETNRPQKRFELFRRHSSSTLKPVQSLRKSLDVSLITPRIFRRAYAGGTASASSQHERSIKPPLSIGGTKSFRLPNLDADMGNLPAQQSSSTSFNDVSAEMVCCASKRPSLDSEDSRKTERFNNSSQIPFVGVPNKRFNKVKKTLIAQVGEHHTLTFKVCPKSVTDTKPHRSLAPTSCREEPMGTRPTSELLRTMSVGKHFENDQVNPHICSSYESTVGFLPKAIRARTCS